MRKQTASEYFKLVANADIILLSKLELLERCRHPVIRTIPGYSGISVSGSKALRPMEDAESARIDMEAKVMDEIRQLKNLPSEAYMVIQNVQDYRSRLVLEKTYLAGKSAEEIGDMLGISVKRYYSLKKEALHAVEAFIPAKAG